MICLVPEVNEDGHQMGCKEHLSDCIPEEKTSRSSAQFMNYFPDMIIENVTEAAIGNEAPSKSCIDLVVGMNSIINS